MEPILLIIVFILFVLIIFSYTKSNLDFVAISLLCCFIAATITGTVIGIGFDIFIGFIEWEAIIIILSMSIITRLAKIRI